MTAAMRIVHEAVEAARKRAAAGALPMTSDGEPMAASLFVCALEQSPEIGHRKHPIRAARAARAWSARFLLSWGVETPQSAELRTTLAARVAEREAADAAMQAELSAALETWEATPQHCRPKKPRSQWRGPVVSVGDRKLAAVEFQKTN